MKSYFTFLGRNKLYTAIQFFGLAIALGVVILLTSYADTEFNIGNNQSYSHQLYAVGYGDGIGMTTGTAPELFPSIPEIKEWTRLIHIEAADFMIDNQYYQVNGIAADPNFFQMLNYTLIGCDRNKALIGTDEVILSEPFAHKVFGNENPIGRTVMYLNQTPLRVIGVLPAFSSTELLKPIDILIPFKLAEKDYAWMDSYGSTQILITLEEGVTPDVVTRKLLDKYKGYWEYWKEDNSTNRLFWGSSVTRMDEIYFSPLNQYGPFRKGTRKQVQILLSLAFVLLLSAIFNYINLTVSQTSKRAHEMATRRLMGDSAGQIVLRYLAESAIFTTGCFIGGCLVAVITKPYFEYLLHPDRFGLFTGDGSLFAVTMGRNRRHIGIVTSHHHLQIQSDRYRKRKFPHAQQATVQPLVHHRAECHQHGTHHLGTHHGLPNIPPCHPADRL